MSELNLETTTLRMVRTRKRYERFAPLIPAGTVNAETTTLLKLMGQFFAATDVAYLTFDTFWPYVLTRFPNWKPEQIALWQGMIRPIELANPEGLDEIIIEQLLATEMANKTLKLIESYQKGEEVDLIMELKSVVDATETALIRKVKTPEVELDWQDMTEEEENMSGLRWRLPEFNDSMRPLRGGDFGILALRPGRGKTTIGASETTFMAEQLRDYYEGEVRPFIWLNNEGPGRRIMARLRQSLLGKSSKEIAAMGWDNAKAEFIARLGGDERMIQVLDIHGMTNYEVEDILRKKTPGLVVFDMIDNIRFVGTGNNNGERNDQVLESMYQWARECCVKYDFPGIAMSQLSEKAEEAGRWPLLGQLKDSRTGKQGACDFILVGGYDPNMKNTRWMSLTKTKLNMQGKPDSPDCAATLDADRGRLNSSMQHSQEETQ